MNNLYADSRMRASTQLRELNPYVVPIPTPAIGKLERNVMAQTRKCLKITFSSQWVSRLARSQYFQLLYDLH